MDELLRWLMVEISHEDGNIAEEFPEHSHDKPGVWDKTGLPCDDCAMWKKARAALASPTATGTQEKREGAACKRCNGTGEYYDVRLFDGEESRPGFYRCDHNLAPDAATAREGE